MSAINQSNNLYIYCMNNPIKYFDSYGLVAGEHFGSADEAAKDWAWNYYESSYYVRFECASIIYLNWDENGDAYYSYTYGVWGDAHSVAHGKAMEFVPSGAIAFAAIHSHPNGSDFSSVDIDLGKNLKWTIYMVVKSSDGVNIKKWSDTRDGYKEEFIIQNQSVATLSDDRKLDLYIKFKSKWLEHIKNGCKQGFHCENKTWPSY